MYFLCSNVSVKLTCKATRLQVYCDKDLITQYELSFFDRSKFLTMSRTAGQHTSKQDSLIDSPTVVNPLNYKYISSYEFNLFQFGMTFIVQNLCDLIQTLLTYSSVAIFLYNLNPRQVCSRQIGTYVCTYCVLGE